MPHTQTPAADNHTSLVAPDLGARLGSRDATAPVGRDAKLASLGEFVAEYGRFPKQRETWNGWAIGRWFMHQTQRPRVRSPEHAARMNEILSSVRPSGREDAWNWMADLVDRYVAQTGEVPIKDVPYFGQPLGQWIRDQRKRYAAGRLRADRIARLEQIPGWLWAAATEDFATGLAHFIAYRDRYRTGWVPLKYVSPDGYPLGSWSRDRRRFRHRQTVAHTAALTEAGFDWARPALSRGELPRPEAEPRLGTLRARIVAAADVRKRPGGVPD